MFRRVITGAIFALALSFGSVAAQDGAHTHDLSAIQVQIDNLQAQLDSLSAALAAGDSTILAQLAVVQTDVATLQSNLTQDELDLSALQLLVGQLEQRVTALEQGGGGGGCTAPCAQLENETATTVDIVFYFDDTDPAGFVADIRNPDDTSYDGVLAPGRPQVGALTSPFVFTADLNASATDVTAVLDIMGGGGRIVDEPLTLPGSGSPPPPVLAQCEDGVDNDGDTLIDYPVDPGCTSLSDDDETDPPPPPPPGGSGGPNEPAGMTQVTYRGFDVAGEDNWGTGGTANRYVGWGYSGLPANPAPVLEMPFNAGLSAGSSGGNMVVGPSDGFETRSGIARPKQFYARMRLQFNDGSGGFEIQQTVQKIFYFQLNSPHDRIAFAGIRPGAAWRTEFDGSRADWRVCGGPQLVRVISGGTVPIGSWTEVEVYARLNTYDPAGAETCDGVLRVWIDGLLAVDVSDVHWLDRAGVGDWGFHIFHFNPVYGGTGTTLGRDQSIFTDELYVSVGP